MFLNSNSPLKFAVVAVTPSKITFELIKLSPVILSTTFPDIFD